MANFCDNNLREVCVTRSLRMLCCMFLRGCLCLGGGDGCVWVKGMSLYGVKTGGEDRW
jgi:hypothetical protein